MSAEAFMDWLRGLLTRPDLELYLDPTKRLTEDFISDVLRIASHQRIVLVADTYEQIRALDNVYKYLNHYGRFIFDTFVPDLNQLINGIKDQTDFDGEYVPGNKLKRIVSTTPDLLNQIINIKFHMEWEEENELKQEDWFVPLRYFFRFELEHLVERSRFEKYKILGDYLWKELNQNSKDFILVCQKQ